MGGGGGYAFTSKIEQLHEMDTFAPLDANKLANNVVDRRTDGDQNIIIIKPGLKSQKFLIQRSIQQDME